MEMPDLTKKVEQRLRELVGTAHERALRKALEPVENALADMRAGKADAFKVSEIIHEFHQKPARDLWVTYQRMGLELALEAALLDELITPAELPSEVRQRFVQRVEDFKRHRESSPVAA